MKCSEIDFHAHILPGCDHGSSDVDTSLTQLQLAAAAGISVICATSHFYPNKDTVKSYLCRREECRNKLDAVLKGNEPKIRLGAEVLICDGLDRLDGLEKLCLEGTDILLLEMPFYRWPQSEIETVFRLSELDNIRIVMAHAERYPLREVSQLMDAGIPVQLNASAFSSLLGRRTYLSLLRAGKAVAIGSDIHGTDPGYRLWEKYVKYFGEFPCIV